ncbi:MAG: efflux RND transporter periplasmic adaptor subunit [Caldimonas sp.]
MKRSSMGVAIAAGALLVAGAFYLGRATRPPSSGIAATPSTSASTPGRKVLYWHDPMVPAQRFDKPGKSPFMDMQLVPVYADSDPDAKTVSISARVQQNLGIRFATVRRAEVASSFDAIGTVQFDERLSTSVQTRVAGYLERLSVRAPMEQVRKGQALATVFAPDWLGPQNELLALTRAGAPGELIGAARQRLVALSIPTELVRESEKTGVAQARYVLKSPANGVVAELGVREGVAVSPGMTLFRIAGLEKVWAVAEIPEAQAIRLMRGQKVRAALQADSAQTFDGVLTEIVPEVSATTRTLKARFEVDNRKGKLTPGMLLRLQVDGATSSRLVVASEAVIRTGTRAVVIVKNDNGQFESRDVTLGADSGEDVEVAFGLREGEHVVVSGQFLIDSEARLRSVLGNMAAASVPAASAAATSMTHVGEGKVEKVALEAITISHGPVATLKWPAMTMGFAKDSPTSFAEIRPGDRVRFEFKEGSAGYELVSVEKLATGAGK